jgi:hypothetical protein
MEENLMNKSRLIGGLICLAIAAFLVVANLRLPPENLMFMLGDRNMPWVPPIALAVFGVVLLATVGVGGGEAEVEPETEVAVDPDRAALNQRLETIAWGCFLIMLGGFLFVPEELIRGGWWSIGVGLIMLGLNAARYMNHLRMSGFTTFLGVVSVISGVLEVIGAYDADGPVLLIVLGAYLLLKPYLERRQLFGKAEHA